eukprot:c15152_g1_i1.p1 GENE.c15152_g1_i1~~c15152_g1_i1.p1  ORF type:complete len:200 (-),score=52.27 c15152_g1_i1:22-621(-)
MFPATARFKEGVRVINTADQGKLPLVLGRVVGKIDRRTERIFTEDEEVQLASVLKLNSNDVKTLLQVSCFIFERAAFHNMNAAKLVSELETAGVAETQVVSFGSCWKDNRVEVCSKLRDSVSTSRFTLGSVDWRLDLQMSQDSLCRLRLPAAILELHLVDNSIPTKPEVENLAVEFGHDELYDLFTQLEKIQDQLDAMR